MATEHEPPTVTSTLPPGHDAFAAAPLGMARCLPDGTLLAANDAFRELLHPADGDVRLQELALDEAAGRAVLDCLAGAAAGEANRRE
ncbi:MAG: hypothetical protein MUE34_16265, partial [Acidimicrobiales bacterium]|nr:hypothetical protein [Acidimicrobiales bacterium]